MDKYELLKILENRFNNNMHRHINYNFKDIKDIILGDDYHINILIKMELAGGQPDLVDLENDELTYIDMSKESPKDRRSLCYDDLALESRKLNKPKSSVVRETSKIGSRLLTKEEYLKIQTIEELDLKTESWLLTDEKIRALGGAIYGQRRFGETFIGANGADSYFSGRGFRTIFILKTDN